MVARPHAAGRDPLLQSVLLGLGRRGEARVPRSPRKPPPAPLARRDQEALAAIEQDVLADRREAVCAGVALEQGHRDTAPRGAAGEQAAPPGTEEEALRRDAVRRDEEDAFRREEELRRNGEVRAARDALRPPLGSGYKVNPYSSFPQKTLAAHLGVTLTDATKTPRAKPHLEDSPEMRSRSERIAMLESAMRAHDAERIATVERGTCAPHSLVAEVKGGSAEPCLRPRRFAERESSRPAVDREVLREELAELKLLDHEQLLERAERLVADCQQADEGMRKIPEDQWLRLATAFGGRSYDFCPPQVLRAVRALGTVHWGLRGKEKPAQRNQCRLLRVADELVASLASRLRGSDIELITEVLETMGDVGVGSQVQLDMLIAQLLALHHSDCRVLTGDLSLRVASALGRLAARLRLRPRGVGGPQTGTNGRFMDILERRIVDRVDECSTSALAHIDHFYLVKLCGEETRRILIQRMAELQIGLREASKQCLGAMVGVEEMTRLECGDKFRMLLPRPVRQYLSQIEELGLRRAGQLAEGNMFTEARQALWRVRHLELGPSECVPEMLPRCQDCRGREREEGWRASAPLWFTAGRHLQSEEPGHIILK